MIRGPAVKELFEQNGYKNVEILKDLAGLDRVASRHIFTSCMILCKKLILVM